VILLKRFTILNIFHAMQNCSLQITDIKHKNM